MKKTLTEEQVCEALRISASTLQRLIREKLFPASFRLSHGKRFWLEEDVESYLHLRSRIGELPGAAEDLPAEEN